MHLDAGGHADVIALAGRPHGDRVPAEDGLQVVQAGQGRDELEGVRAGPLGLLVQQALKPIPVVVTVALSGLM